MCAEFCLNCGKPLYPGGRFCGFCATPVPELPEGSATGPDRGSVNVAEPPPGPLEEASSLPAETAAGEEIPEGDLRGLGQALGIDHTYNFVVKQFSPAGVPSFAVMDSTKHPLFSLRSTTPRFRISFSSGKLPLPHVGGLGPGGMMGSYAHAWSVLDPAGNLRGTLAAERGTVSLASTLVNASQEPVLAATVELEGFGAYTATAALPSGEVLLTASAKVLHSEIEIRNPLGAPVARIHRPTVALADTFFVDLVGNPEPLAPLVLAFLIDRETHAASAQGHPDRGRVAGPPHR